ALRGASFSVLAGEVLGLVGPNGSGKTTLLECVAGLLAADGGIVESGGSPQATDRRDMLFYMPDGILPWPDQSVGWTLRFSASLQRVSPAVVDDIARALGLEAFLHQRVGTLSKGQRKRVLIALAM